MMWTEAAFGIKSAGGSKIYVLFAQLFLKNPVTFIQQEKQMCAMLCVLDSMLTAKATKINYFVSGLESLLPNILWLSFFIANFPPENHI